MLFCSNIFSIGTLLINWFKTYISKILFSKTWDEFLNYHGSKRGSKIRITREYMCRCKRRLSSKHIIKRGFICSIYFCLHSEIGNVRTRSDFAYLRIFRRENYIALYCLWLKPFLLCYLTNAILTICKTQAKKIKWRKALLWWEDRYTFWKFLLSVFSVKQKQPPEVFFKKKGS